MMVKVVGNRKIRRLAMLALAIMGVLLLSQIAVAVVGQGGLWSEKLIGSGGADSRLVMSRGGGPVVVGMGAIVQAIGATNISVSGGTSSAQLNGALTNLNGFPSAVVWFEWGYTPSTAGVQTTAATLTAPGNYNDTITGFDPSRTIYFRMASKTDSVYKSPLVSFMPGSAPGAEGFNIVWWGVLLAIIAGLVIGIIARADSWEDMTAYVMLCVVAYIIAEIILRSLW